jgi:hypothetical protein
MSDPSQLDVQAKLDAIRRDVADLKRTLDRIVVGEDGHGLLDRQARNEERINSLRAFCAWLAAGVVGTGALVIHVVFGKPQ